LVSRAANKSDKFKRPMEVMNNALQYFTEEEMFIAAFKFLDNGPLKDR
jgi:hypothetical protein